MPERRRQNRARRPAPGLLALLVLALGASDPATPAAAEVLAIPPPTEEALRLHRTSNAFWIVSQLLGIGLPLGLLAAGVLPRLARACRRRWGQSRLGGWPAAVLFVVASYLLLRLLLLPYDFYLGYVRAHAYGLSNQSVGRWASHWAIRAALSASILAAVAPLLHGLIRRSPRRWWLWAGLAALPLTLGLAVLQPVVFDPLFNRQRPLADPELEARIQALARKANIDGATILQVDKSRDTRAVNAYVNGWLGTRRIVLWDTLLETLDDDEVLAVVGHEMGHYVLGHVLRGILVSSGLVVLGLALTHTLALALIGHRRLGPRLGVASLADLEALPLLLACGIASSLVLTPVGYAYSRHIERQADRFGLELTQNNRAAASSFVKLYQANKGVPRPAPLYRVFRATHPSMADRVAFLSTYRPWATGQPLTYGSRLRGEPPAADRLDARPEAH